MARLAGRVDLTHVMAALAERRPLFHSEADFQFEFARTVCDLDPAIGVRLEVPRREEARRRYIDLVCRGDRTTLIEFKYVTCRWDGSDGISDEQFELRNHEALDLARLHFIRDVERLEQWVAAEPEHDGIAVMLTNDGRLWEPPRVRAQPTRDAAFRLHEGRQLAGRLTWGTPERPFVKNNVTLRGTYRATWNEYRRVDDTGAGRLRWLAWAVA